MYKRDARTCYDHLAGKVSVEITEALIKKGLLEEKENNYSMIFAGVKWFNSIKIDTGKLLLKNVLLHVNV